jgi:hypothetical protein
LFERVTLPIETQPHSLGPQPLPVDKERLFAQQEPTVGRARRRPAKPRRPPSSRPSTLREKVHPMHPASRLGVTPPRESLRSPLLSGDHRDCLR